MQRPRGFDNEKYLEQQSKEILERIERFNNRLYLEFGGKLMYDMHAARVLPGYDPNVKIQLLQRLKEKAEIIIAIHAGAIERKKVRADFGITYDADTIRLIDDLREFGLDKISVVITRFTGQMSATIFKKKLERGGIRVYIHRATNGYPTDIDSIVSEEGFGQNPRIEVERPLVVVTAPGPNSGKLATCLSQLYHDHKAGIKAGYAKFETFPIWNLPLKHPVNIAYEAATVDLHDYNLIDPHHLEAHGLASVNYNRDVDVFPVLKRILERISGESSPYQSPTDMGVNRAGFGIIDDAVVRKAATQETIRRYFKTSVDYIQGHTDKETVDRAEMIIQQAGLKLTERSVVQPARDVAALIETQKKGHKGIFVGAAIELPDGVIITGKNSPLMHASASMILNAIKHLAGIPDAIHLLPPHIVSSVKEFKKGVLDSRSASLDLEETLIMLAIGATLNPSAHLAMEKLRMLRGCDCHLTHIPTTGDESGFRKLGVHLTTDPNFAANKLFVG